MHNQVEIRQVDNLSKDDLQRLMGWGDNIFGTAHLDIVYRPKDGTERRFVVYVDGDGPLSHAAVLRHTATVNGSIALIGGIGGVVTVPEAQRRGYATLVVGHATDFLQHEWKTDLAMLFCIDRMLNFYEDLGWAKVTCPVLLEQPKGKIPSPFHVMAKYFNLTFQPIQNIDLGCSSW